MMELFDKRFVHFMWDDELKGKTGIMSNDIKCLRDYVNNKSCTELIEQSRDESQSFKTTDGIKFRFAYYDPNYEVKKAVNEGKVVQYLTDKGQWETILSNMELMSHIEKSRQLRVKPEKEEKWIAYLARDEAKPYLTACREDIWKTVQEEDGAKTKLFIGSAVEVTAWYEARQKFAPLIKAWEDGKTIQFYSAYEDGWKEYYAGEPFWKPSVDYRVKPGEKEYRPYNNSDEMIDDFVRRFKVNCPPHCEPLIWVKGKGTGNRYLVFAFCENAIELNDGEEFEFKPLFDCCTYLDGSPCGMEVKK